MIFDNCHSNALICLFGDTTLIQYHSYVYRMRFKSCLLTYFACPTLKYNGLSKYFWSVIVASHISILTLYTQGCPNVEVTNQYIACIHITRLKLNFEYMQNTLLIDEAKLSVHWKSYSGVFPTDFLENSCFRPVIGECFLWISLWGCTKAELSYSYQGLP